jgi:hypothetical protein
MRSSFTSKFSCLGQLEWEGTSQFEYILSPALRAVLGKISRRLSDAAGTDSSAIRQAAEWHMRKFDMDVVRMSD